jgi:hypothetical protein
MNKLLPLIFALSLLGGSASHARPVAPLTQLQSGLTVITRMFVTSTTLEWSSRTKGSAGSDHFCRVLTGRVGGTAIDLTSGKLVGCSHQVHRHSAT